MKSASDSTAESRSGGAEDRAHGLRQPSAASVDLGASTQAVYVSRPCCVSVELMQRPFVGCVSTSCQRLCSGERRAFLTRVFRSISTAQFPPFRPDRSGTEPASERARTRQSVAVSDIQPLGSVKDLLRFLQPSHSVAPVLQLQAEVLSVDHQVVPAFAALHRSCSPAGVTVHEPLT